MAKGKALTGVQKAAILFVTLGPEASSKIIKRLPESEIQKVTFEIANMQGVKPEVRDEILAEFVEMNKAKDFIVEGGLEYARDVLSKALGPQRAEDILDKVTEATQQFRPFAIARKAETYQLLNVLVNEHPQTIAVVLCNLPAEKGAQILAELPKEVQEEVSYRIATMNTTSPEVIKRVENVLEGKLSNVLTTESAQVGGVSVLVDILNQVDRSTERNITDFLDAEDTELAIKVKESMFVFEDIITLDGVSIQRVLKELDLNELALALKGSSEEVQEAIFKNQSRRAAESLKEEMEFLGPVRLMDVERAQSNVVAIIRKLDESGEIILARGADNAVIV